MKSKKFLMALREGETLTLDIPCWAVTAARDKTTSRLLESNQAIAETELLFRFFDVVKLPPEDASATCCESDWFSKACMYGEEEPFCLPVVFSRSSYRPITITADKGDESTPIEDPDTKYSEDQQQDTDQDAGGTSTLPLVREDGTFKVFIEQEIMIAALTGDINKLSNAMGDRVIDFVTNYEIVTVSNKPIIGARKLTGLGLTKMYPCEVIKREIPTL